VLAYAIMVLDHGRIHLDEAGPITKIDNAKGGIYVQQPPGVAWYTETTHVARRLANSANYSPDFPAAAQTWAAMVRKQTGQTIDGVIAIDPYAIAAALDTGIATVERTRRQLLEEGFAAVLKRKYNPNSARPRIFDGAAEAKLIALTLSPAPEGFARWSLRLLEEKVVELNIVEKASDNTIGRTLKKTFSNRISSSNG
jgi:hypothetical protein